MLETDEAGDEVRGLPVLPVAANGLPRPPFMFPAGEPLFCVC